jgi:eukaryotic-like serine/threonine-protein kinase
MRLFGTPAKPRIATKPAEDRPVELTLVTPKPRALEDGPIGKVYLGKYKLRRFLGEGSNAHVYLATDVADPNRKVCIKRIKESAAQGPRFSQFFQAEVRSMSKFAHPYCVRLLDASLTDPLGPGLVMEYIEGITLETLFNAGGRIQYERLAKLIGPLGHGLYAAQKAGIAHRDLKPANLMVIEPGTPAESLKIMDFGFAGFTAKPHIQLAELTGEGGIHACGTPAYVSPEMIRGDSTDARADIYSVGVILYEMLTGRLPFDYNDTQKLLNAHVRETPPKFAKMGVHAIPPAVEQVVMQALSKFPSERHDEGLGGPVFQGTRAGHGHLGRVRPAGRDARRGRFGILECDPNDERGTAGRRHR